MEELRFSVLCNTILKLFYLDFDFLRAIHSSHILKFQDSKEEVNNVFIMNLEHIIEELLNSRYEVSALHVSESQTDELQVKFLKQIQVVLPK